MHRGQNIQNHFLISCARAMRTVTMLITSKSRLHTMTKAFLRLKNLELLLLCRAKSWWLRQPMPVLGDVFYGQRLMLHIPSSHPMDFVKEWRYLKSTVILRWSSCAQVLLHNNGSEIDLTIENEMRAEGQTDRYCQSVFCCGSVNLNLH